MSIYDKKRPESIQAMFNHIAQRYDRTNAVMSFNLHHLWNTALVKNVVIPCAPKSLVDLCAGTGEIAFRSIKAAPSLENVYLVDFSEEMLTCAKQKGKELVKGMTDLTYIQADVQNLPFPDNFAQCFTMAYGIRNVSSASRCLQEVYRTLEPGGSFGILELTEPENPLMRMGHRLYLRTALPLFGKWLTANREAYSYLRDSIHSFVKPTALKKELQDAGFRHIKLKPLFGGVATLFIAQKLP